MSILKKDARYSRDLNGDPELIWASGKAPSTKQSLRWLESWELRGERSLSGCRTVSAKVSRKESFEQLKGSGKSGERGRMKLEWEAEALCAMLQRFFSSS